MNADERLVILDRHKKWIYGEIDGERADFFGADLSEAILYKADLREADLRKANLRLANLYKADLREADFREASLRGANLFGADLRGADLRGVDLYGADLFGANLFGANLFGANLCGANLCGAKNLPDLSWTSIVPEEGAFIGWKRVHQFIVKLEICAYAKRSNATGRKCRCSAAKVLDIQNKDGTPAIAYDGTLITSVTNTNVRPRTTYSVGEIVLPDSFNDNRWEECTNGIHFFITRQEAVDY